MEKGPEPYLDLAEQIEAANALELAIIVVDSAAQQQNPNEDPYRFWGNRYNSEVDRTRTYIEGISLVEAKLRFKEGRLNIGE